MISIYIATYRSPVDLNNNIASILESGAEVRINVINNHSEFFLEPKHEMAVTVLHNSLRPNFSLGHLARNWNQALLHGFQDLNNPASDIVITVQDDVIFKSNWLPCLLDLHRRYSFITMGGGDAFCSYQPQAVRKIGMWDERFCSIGYQEGDYFLRALIYNREESSINDIQHGRLHNAVPGNIYNSDPIYPNMDLSKGMEGRGDNDEETIRADSMLITLPRRNLDRKRAHVSSMRMYGIPKAVFLQKWGLSDTFWTEKHHAVRKSLVPNYITYPYFEKDVEGLREKNYVVSDDFLAYGS